MSTDKYSDGHMGPNLIYQVPKDLFLKKNKDPSSALIFIISLDQVFGPYKIMVPSMT